MSTPARRGLRTHEALLHACDAPDLRTCGPWRECKGSFERQFIGLARRDRGHCQVALRKIWPEGDRAPRGFARSMGIGFRGGRCAREQGRNCLGQTSPGQGESWIEPYRLFIASDGGFRRASIPVVAIWKKAELPRRYASYAARSSVVLGVAVILSLGSNVTPSARATSSAIWRCTPNTSDKSTSKLLAHTWRSLSIWTSCGVTLTLPPLAFVRSQRTVPSSTYDTPSSAPTLPQRLTR